MVPSGASLLFHPPSVHPQALIGAAPSTAGRPNREFASGFWALDILIFRNFVCNFSKASSTTLYLAAWRSPELLKSLFPDSANSSLLSPRQNETWKLHSNDPASELAILHTSVFGCFASVT